MNRRRFVAEAIGTYFLVLIGPGAAMVNAWSAGGLGVTGIALAFAFVVIAMVYGLADVSGAHINPAVTIAFWSAGRFPGRDVVPYIMAQCLGAAAASATLRLMLGPVGQLGATLPAIPVASAFGLEWLLSFALMLVIMASPPRFAAIAIGLTVGFCALVGGPLTGASMNPARSFGPALMGGFWHAHWVYWLAPITAMIAAARLCDWLLISQRDDGLQRRRAARWDQARHEAGGDERDRPEQRFGGAERLHTVE